MADMTALWREDATEQEQLDTYQQLIQTGDAWRLEGHVGRTAMSLIEGGYCTLGDEPCRDFYGNRIPSRFEVEPGTKGSAEFVERMTAEREGTSDDDC